MTIYSKHFGTSFEQIGKDVIKVTIVMQMDPKEKSQQDLDMPLS